MNDDRTVEVQFVGGRRVSCKLEISKSPPWMLRISGVMLGVSEFSAKDLFSALVELRLELEKADAQILCTGARVDVYPSAMSRDMGSGRRAYVIRLGLPSRRADMVDIFDPEDSDAVGSVACQEVFHKKWIESLRNK